MYRAAQALRTRGWRAVAGRRAPSHRTTVTTTKPTVLDLLRQQRGRPTGDAVRKSPIPAGTNLAEVAAAEEDELSYYEDQCAFRPAPARAAPAAGRSMRRKGPSRAVCGGGEAGRGAEPAAERSMCIRRVRQR